jgi:hypothetical protein
MLNIMNKETKTNKKSVPPELLRKALVFRKEEFEILEKRIKGDQLLMKELIYAIKFLQEAIKELSS